MAVDFSKMDKLIRIEQTKKKSDGKGGNTEKWELYAEVWCEAVPIYGREIYKYRGLTEKIDMEMRIRYREELTDPKIKSLLRIVYGKKILHINAIIDTLESRERLEILCTWE